MEKIVPIRRADALSQPTGAPWLEKCRSLLEDSQQELTDEAKALVVKQRDDSRESADKLDAGRRFYRAEPDWQEGTLHRIMCKPLNRFEKIFMPAIILILFGLAAKLYLTYPPF